MVEVRSLEIGAEPEGREWVLVEKRGKLYFITGRKDAKTVDATIAPAGLDDPEAAMHAAAAWADLLHVGVLYVRDVPRPKIKTG
jgi:hypothetical protein